jgi:Mg2+/Co2+ transporter CorC
MVVNNFEELVGVLSVEDVLEQIIGKQIVDEFDRYDDLRSVAAREAQKEHTHHEPEHIESGEETQEPEPDEVGE